ncbi:uncharacterized protein LOC143148493 [Ptiloglossa arizonensis]|uniref:uncharacterized protein LOC143148493 n=1 Tax=Ptiloglossa arizonensis TaxID=3350558 RepID=UPI003FA02C3E
MREKKEIGKKKNCKPFVASSYIVDRVLVDHVSVERSFRDTCNFRRYGKGINATIDFSAGSTGGPRSSYRARSPIEIHAVDPLSFLSRLPFLDVFFVFFLADVVSFFTARGVGVAGGLERSRGNSEGRVCLRHVCFLAGAPRDSSVLHGPPCEQVRGKSFRVQRVERVVSPPSFDVSSNLRQGLPLRSLNSRVIVRGTCNSLPGRI